MTRILLTLATLLVAALPLSAQDLTLTGTLQGTMAEGQRLFIIPVDNTPKLRLDTIHVSGNSLSGHVSTSPYGIYRIFNVYNRTQALLPLALTAKDGSLSLTLASDSGKVSVVSPNADSRALMAFNDCYGAKAKQIWMDGKTMTDDQLRAFVCGYQTTADSLNRALKTSPVISQYLSLWASVVTFETMENMKFMTDRTVHDLGLDSTGLMSRLCRSADCDMVAAFDVAARLLLSNIGGGNITERMADVYAKYKNSRARGMATDLLLNSYISSFDYSNSYDEGLKTLTALTEKYSLSDKYLNEFRVRKASIVGTPFPENVTLYDLLGHTVSVDQFRGKYVYIDMWASWCAPCIREIPYLREVERTLQNKDVVFVSISIDNNETAWKNKVDELHLTGNQLLCKDNSLGNALNIHGIPFFLIYDKDGKLYKYNAPRPSNPQLRQLLESLH